MALLNRNNIQQITADKTTIVEIADWGCEVKLKQLSIKEQLEIEKINKAKSNDSEIVYAAIMFCCVDEDNNPIFTHISDIENLPANGVVQLFKECLKFNGLDQQDLEIKAKN